MPVFRSLKILPLGAALFATSSLAQMEDVVIEAQPLRDGIYMLTGAGGNMGLSVGDDATFLIDDQFAPLTDRIVAAIAKVSDRPVDYVLNTHWHYDHTGGNENFGKSGSLIMAHDNVRARMVAGQNMGNGRVIEPAVPAALPVVTFNDSLGLHVNGQTVRGIHVNPAHTDGDTIVHFQEANAMHMGDIFNHGSYPFVDLSSGGHIDGIIEACAMALELADDETLIIPGHGSVARRGDLKAYHDRLVAIRERIAQHVAAGQSLEEILAAKPTADFDDEVDTTGFVKTEGFVTAVVKSLQMSMD
ncbi:MAG: MBL fold metallo-hydrolase [Halieaceae bacterium]|jgi:glyoxylase-like metal-dependent hydrolase (beta-lactamase superfamily II)|nr:MBL fold metallo-hydrolase [Halieaceae bacterium]